MYIKRFFLVLLSAAMVLAASGNALAEYVLQDEIQFTIGGMDGTADVHRPAVAYNWLRKEYLSVSHSDLIFSGDSKINDSRVSPDRSNTYLGYVSTGDKCKYPDVAYDHHNDRNLIVWSQYNSGASRWEIYGKVIPWNNTPFLIAAWSGVHLEIPTVALDTTL